MLSLIARVLIVGVAMSGLCSVSERSEAGEPVKLIFDTDMGNDIDDALALGVIHALQSRGECELLCVTSTKDNAFSAPYCDLVNTFYRRGGIPVGAVKNGKTPEESKYIQVPVEAKDEGKDRYPRTQESYAEAVGLLRKTLAGQPDQSVVIVTVGFSTNIARLLETPGDEVSKLNGKDLVKQKVKLLSIMAGMFTAEGRHKEYNVYIDIEAAEKVYAEWPTPIVASGFEVGLAIEYPASSIVADYEYVPHHPLKEAYGLYLKMPYDRPTWDLTSVLYAVRPEHGYFGVSKPGRITVNKEMVTEFQEVEGGRDQYLTVTPEQIIRVKEALIQLSSQPPGG